MKNNDYLAIRGITHPLTLMTLEAVPFLPTYQCGTHSAIIKFCPKANRQLIVPGPLLVCSKVVYSPFIFVASKVYLSNSCRLVVVLLPRVPII